MHAYVGGIVDRGPFFWIDMFAVVQVSAPAVVYSDASVHAFAVRAFVHRRACAQAYGWACALGVQVKRSCA